MVKKLRLSIVLLALLTLPQTGQAFGGNSAPAPADLAEAAASGDEIMITLRAPLFSEAFSETPVAMVNDEPITMWDMARNMAAMHSEMRDEEASGKKDYANLLERLITIRLIVQEARNIGLHELDGVQAQIDEFTTTTLLKDLMARRLHNLEPQAEKVDELYRRMSREVLFSTLKFAERKNAELFLEKMEGKAGFDELAAQFIAEGKAEGGKDEQHVKLRELQPQVAMAAFEMETGDVSQIFRDEEGSVIFKIEDMRFVEDPDVREEARQKALAALRKEKAREYSEQLEAKHADIDEELLAEVDFEKETTGYLWFEETKPVDFDRLLEDKRVLATVPGDEPVTITIADVARGVKAATYHGVENKPANELNEKKDIVFHNILFKIVGKREAVSQGLDQAREFLFKLEEYKNSLLFGAFIDKVIAPEVKLQEEKVKEYYEGHKEEEYSTPPMLRLRSIAFDREKEAKEALAKLRQGADFKWVSANTPGQADKEAKGLLSFDQNLLSLTALPADLQGRMKNAVQGDFLLYAPEEGFAYVLAVTNVYPAEPRPYEQVRGDISKILFNEKLKDSIYDYADKLKEAYETEIFVKELDRS